MIAKLIGGVPQKIELRTTYPNCSFPAELTQANLPDECYLVVETEAPTALDGYRVAKGPLQMVNDQCVTTWVQTQLTAEEVAAQIAQARASLSAAVEAHLNAKAREYRYSSYQSARSYANDPNPKFAAEGQAFVAWTSAVWTHCDAVELAVANAQRAMPTPAELVSELPLLTGL